MTSQVWQKTGSECSEHACLFPVPPGSVERKKSLNILSVERPKLITSPTIWLTNVVRVQIFGAKVNIRITARVDVCEHYCNGSKWCFVSIQIFLLGDIKGEDIKKQTFCLPSTGSDNVSMLSIGFRVCSRSRSSQSWQRGTLSRWLLWALGKLGSRLVCKITYKKIHIWHPDLGFSWNQLFFNLQQ